MRALVVLMMCVYVACLVALAVAQYRMGQSERALSALRDSLATASAQEGDAPDTTLVGRWVYEERGVRPMVTLPAARITIAPMPVGRRAIRPAPAIGETLIAYYDRDSVLRINEWMSFRARNPKPIYLYFNSADSTLRVARVR